MLISSIVFILQTVRSATTDVKVVQNLLNDLITPLEYNFNKQLAIKMLRKTFSVASCTDVIAAARLREALISEGYDKTFVEDALYLWSIAKLDKLPDKISFVRLLSNDISTIVEPQQTTPVTTPFNSSCSLPKINNSLTEVKATRLYPKRQNTPNYHPPYPGENK